jgi:hypothetical protein
VLALGRVGGVRDDGNLVDQPWRERQPLRVELTAR